jgi:plastocyanin
MDFLNSRHLTDKDGFAQLFTVADEYIYHLTTAPQGVKSLGEPDFTIIVLAAVTPRGAGKQHDVAVAWDAGRRGYDANPAKLEISQNDFVLWHCDRSSGLPPFAVRGEGSHGSFASDAMGPTAGFTHVFISPGNYSYTIQGKGSHSVAVSDHRRVTQEVRQEQWRKVPEVIIRGGEATPARVEIISGQTVLWSVESDHGITIETATR